MQLGGQCHWSTAAEWLLQLRAERRHVRRGPTHKSRAKWARQRFPPAGGGSRTTEVLISPAATDGRSPPPTEPFWIYLTHPVLAESQEGAFGVGGAGAGGQGDWGSSLCHAEVDQSDLSLFSLAAR